VCCVCVVMYLEKYVKLKYNNQLSLFLKKTVKENETRSFLQWIINAERRNVQRDRVSLKTKLRACLVQFTMFLRWARWQEKYTCGAAYHSNIIHEYCLPQSWQNKITNMFTFRTGMKSYMLDFCGILCGIFFHNTLFALLLPS